MSNSQQDNTKLCRCRLNLLLFLFFISSVFAELAVNPKQSRDRPLVVDSNGKKYEMLWLYKLLPIQGSRSILPLCPKF